MKRNIKSILIIILFVFVFVISTIILNYHNVLLSLKGNDEINLDVFSNYIDEGIFFKYDDKNIDVKYKINTDLNISKVGKYKYTYLINYKKKKYSISRIINVVDKVSPIIEVDNNEVIVSNCKKNSFNNLSFIATDNYDGDITNKVTYKFENDKVNLSVTDSSGNEAKLSLNVIYNDDINHIELEGNYNVYLKKDSSYEEKGAKVFNSCLKEQKNENIEISGNVDTSTSGIYYIIYKYNNIVKRRRVEVYEEVLKDKVKENNEKVIYLTFDDGPGQYTEELLNILDKYGIKATFFVTNQFKKYIPLIGEEYKKGHKIAIHTYSHNWKIYDSFESYLSDFYKMQDVVKEYTGSYSNLFRFPGGSSNTVSKSHSTGVVSRIASYMNQNNYVYFDWNVDSGDAAGASSEEIKNNVIDGISKNDISVILMHDIKRNTIDSIEDIIKYAIDNGYTFKTLDISSETKHHRINN